MVEMKLEQSIGQLKQADQVLVFDCVQVVNPPWPQLRSLAVEAASTA